MEIKVPNQGVKTIKDEFARSVYVEILDELRNHKGLVTYLNEDEGVNWIYLNRNQVGDPHYSIFFRIITDLAYQYPRREDFVEDAKDIMGRIWDYADENYASPQKNQY